MIKINNFSDFFAYADRLPVSVFKDIDKRMGDWLATGGTLEDDYIKQQFKYAERVINRG